MHPYYDAEFAAGDTILLEFGVQKDGQVRDLTGCNVVFALEIQDNCIKKTIGDGVFVDDPASGNISVVLSPADTEAYKASGAVGEFQLALIKDGAQTSQRIRRNRGRQSDQEDDHLHKIYLRRSLI